MLDALKTESLASFLHHHWLMIVLVIIVGLWLLEEIADALWKDRA